MLRAAPNHLKVSSLACCAISSKNGSAAGERSAAKSCTVLCLRISAAFTSRSVKALKSTLSAACCTSSKMSDSIISIPGRYAMQSCAAAARFCFSFICVTPL